MRHAIWPASWLRVWFIKPRTQAPPLANSSIYPFFCRGGAWVQGYGLLGLGRGLGRGLGLYSFEGRTGIKMSSFFSFFFFTHHNAALVLVFAFSASSQIVTPSHVHTFFVFWNNPADRAIIPHISLHVCMYTCVQNIYTYKFVG